MKRFFRNPFVFSFLTLIGAVFLMGVATSLAQNAPETLQKPVHAILEMGLLVLFALAVKKRLGEGFILGFHTEGLAAGVKLVLFFLPAALVNLVEFAMAAARYPLAVAGAEIPGAVLSALLQGIRPGVSEELAFRVLVMGSFLHLARGKTWRVYAAAVFSSLIFGLIHLNNLSSGQALAVTLVQVMYSVAAGMLFAGVYARTRNILPAILLHALVDSIVSLKYALFQPAPSTGFTGGELVLYVLLSLLWLGAGLYFIRRSRHGEILAVWDAGIKKDT